MDWATRQFALRNLFVWIAALGVVLTIARRLTHLTGDDYAKLTVLGVYCFLVWHGGKLGRQVSQSPLGAIIGTFMAAFIWFWLLALAWVM